MRKIPSLYLFVSLTFFLTQCRGQEPTSDGPYIYKTGSSDGIGKWFMGREIAHVMGYQGIDWLERSDREAEENTSKLLRDMDISPEDTIADIGAGSGYHVFKMAPMASNGLIYAVDIQDEMLAALNTKKQETGIKNIKVVKGGEKSVNLPENSVDKILMVDVYHEFNFPVEMINSIKKALRPNGEIYLIEYRGEDENIPIKQLHKMTEKQAIKEMKAAGMELKENKNNLPWQHCMIFVKEQIGN